MWIVCLSITARPLTEPRLSVVESASLQLGDLPVMGDRGEYITINTADQGIASVAQPRRVLRDHIQHRLNVRRRTGDHAKDLTRRRLLLQRLGEIAIARLLLVNSRAFSIAITAWSAKVSSSLICLSEKGRTSRLRI